MSLGQFGVLKGSGESRNLMDLAPHPEKTDRGLPQGLTTNKCLPLIVLKKEHRDLRGANLLMTDVSKFSATEPEGRSPMGN